jgi:hypothetical protein
MWPTVAGHLLDTLAIAFAVNVLARPQSLGRLLTLAGLTLAAFLTYISSLFNLTGFLAALAALERKLAPRLLLCLAIPAALTVALLYASFTGTFVTEILPAWLREGANTSGGPATQGGLLSTLSRLPLFYGYGYPALAVAGIVLARRRASRAGFLVLAAYALAFLLLVGLRGLGGGLFKDLKEVLFVGPLLAVLAGASLETLAARGREGRLAAWLLALGLMVFGLGKYGEQLRVYSRIAQVQQTSPTLQAESAKLADGRLR